MKKTFLILFLIFYLIKSNDEAKLFVEKVNQELDKRMYFINTVDWAYNTNITKETEAKSVAANLEHQIYMKDVLKETIKFLKQENLDQSTKRQLQLLKTVSQPPLNANEDNENLLKYLTEMNTLYSSGKFCENGKCQNLDDFETILMNSKNYEELQKAWVNWRTVVKGMKTNYQHFVELSNKGAREIEFKDTGDLWKSGYDMSSDEFSDVVDNLWNKVSPLYKQLHCYVRKKLKIFHKEKFNSNYIPAHICGNMWCQEWGNIYDIVVPYPNQPNQVATPGIIRKGWDGKAMEKFTESFFTGIGLPSFPSLFWEKSMFERPQGRDVVCHASAWDLNHNDENSTQIQDVRIKMCTRRTEEDLLVQHHESGHIQYYQAYANQPPIFRGGAHDGFHESIGDTIALSVTPQYLKDAGLLDRTDDSKEGEINRLMLMALRKISFLPFGLLIDKWRWKVFNGEIKPSQYNEEWWKLRKHYQGVAPPVTRSEDDFDPGAKFHIPANVPYIRYFLAYILQFQFHEALCKISGHTGPLWKCSIANNKAAGLKLQEMLKLGSSKRWQEALEVITSTQSMDSISIVNYFQPLLEFLKEENKDEVCGWIEEESMETKSIIAGMYSIVVIFAVFVMFGIMGLLFKFKQLKNEKYEMMKQEKEELEENPFEMNE
jgi:peptidyl-dipeptidase A